MLHGGRFYLLVPFPCHARGRVPSWDASRHRELSVGAPCVKPSSRQLCLQRAGLNFVAEPHGVRPALLGLGQSFGGIGAVLGGCCPMQRGTGRGWELTSSRGSQQQDKQPADSQSEALPSLWGQTDGTQVILAWP